MSKTTPATDRYIDHPDYHRPDAEHRLFPAGYELPPLPPPVLIDLTRPPPGKQYAGRDTPVLTKDEERLTFQRYNYAKRRAATAASEAARLPWAKRARHLREYLVRQNLSLVPHAYHVLRRGLRKELDTEEAASAGNVCLLRCVEAFNVAHGFKFSSYAVHSIINQFGTLLYREAKRAAKAHTQDVSYLSAHDDDRIAAPAVDRPEWDEVDQLRRVLATNEAGLTDDQRAVIHHRFLADDHLTLAECGQKLGFSKERSRQVELKALRKLREFLAPEDAAPSLGK